MLRCIQVACGIGIFLGTAPSEPAGLGASLDRQAEDLYTKGDLKEAIRIARLAVDAASGPKRSGRSLDRLGFFEADIREFKGRRDLPAAGSRTSQK